MKLLPFIVLLVTNCLFGQYRYSVVIDEIMADPSPQVGLPNHEWIELRNVSAIPVDLQGWRFETASGESGPMPGFVLQPDSFVLVCTASAVADLSLFGATLSITSFPSLDNNGERLVLKSNSGTIIHAVEYSFSWYGNEIKKDGGWTLEMIDANNPCTGSDNWTAAHASIGGTPGTKNSVDAVIADQSSPQLKNAIIDDPQTILLVFNEPLDSLLSSVISNYHIDNGLMVSEATALAPLYNQVQLKVTTPVLEQVIYSISVDHVSDCSGNIMGTANNSRTGRPVDAGPGDLIINEILFNPRPGGYDYVEIYNKSNKILDASRIYIANRNSSGVISSAKTLRATPFYIFPGDYFVITEDAENLAFNYLAKDPGSAFIISPMPSYPDDAGDVVLLNSQGEPTDEVKYNKGWHFKLLDNDEGVSLERIDPAGNSQDASNWHSAASTVGYGTPGYKNSQFRQAAIADATIAISPAVFSPDNDGHDDIASVNYAVNDPGYLANITIFDGLGRPVRVLVNNGTLGHTGIWNWDGLNDKGSKLPVGTYIVYTEIFNLQGKRRHFKNAIVLAGKMN